MLGDGDDRSEDRCEDADAECDEAEEGEEGEEEAPEIDEPVEPDVDIESEMIRAATSCPIMPFDDSTRWNIGCRWEPDQCVLFALLCKRAETVPAPDSHVLI